MNQFDLEDYCIDDISMSGEKLISLFDKTEKHINEIYSKELTWMQKEAPAVKTMFAEMLKEMC